MAGTTVVPSSLLPRRSAAAAADLHSSCSRVRLNPASMANPAAAKTPKRPVSVRDGQPPAPKRVRGASSRDELHVTGPANIKNSSKIPCPSSGNDPRSPTCLHASVIKNQVAESPSSATQSKPPISMRELIENARLAMAPAAAEERMVDMDWAHPAVEEEASPRRDIERSRAEARRKVEQMVITVQFNDPYIDPSDVTRTPEELLQARQEAWRVQAQLIEMAHRRNMHGDVAQVM